MYDYLYEARGVAKSITVLSYVIFCDKTDLCADSYLLALGAIDKQLALCNTVDTS